MLTPHRKNYSRFSGNDSCGRGIIPGARSHNSNSNQGLVLGLSNCRAEAHSGPFESPQNATQPYTTPPVRAREINILQGELLVFKKYKP